MLRGSSRARLTCSAWPAMPAWRPRSPANWPRRPRKAGRRAASVISWTTLDSWSRGRRVIGKAECTRGEPNPRFIVTSLKPKAAEVRYLYERVYCARGEMENRIKECQLDLFADRTSSHTMRANQLRLWFASMAYVLSAPCAASAWPTPNSPPPPAAPSVWRCSRSSPWCGSASGVFTSPWHRAARGKTSSDWPTYGSPPSTDELENASPITPASSHRARPLNRASTGTKYKLAATKPDNQTRHARKSNISSSPVRDRGYSTPTEDGSPVFPAPLPGSGAPECILGSEGLAGCWPVRELALMRR
jgi:hypothetical protein